MEKINKQSKQKQEEEDDSIFGLFLSLFIFATINAQIF